MQRAPKPDLSKNFCSLCSPSTPLSRFLFGDALKKSVEDITKANKIMAKVMPKKGKTSSDNRQDKRRFFYGIARPHHAAGRYNYSYNNREFSRGKPSRYDKGKESKA